MSSSYDIENEYKQQLKEILKRSSSLGNLIRIINGAFLTIFIAFFTIIQNDNYVKIAPNYLPIVFVLILIIWRYYIHFIDTELIDVYHRIIHCQNHISFFKNSEVSLKGILQRQHSQKWNLVFFNRGQLVFDLVAFAIMLLISSQSQEVLTWFMIAFYVVFFVAQNIIDVEKLRKLRQYEN